MYGVLLCADMTAVGALCNFPCAWNSPCPDPFAPCVGYDRGGDNERVLSHYQGTASDCEQLCFNASDCLAWTWCGVGAVGPGPRCCLKSEVPNSVGPFAHMVTGIAPRAKGRIPKAAMAFGGNDGQKIVYDPRGGMISISPGGSVLPCDSGTTAGPLRIPAGGNLTLHVFVDGGLIEVVANGVLTLAMPVDQVLADRANDAVKVFGGHAAAVNIWRLNSIWS